MSRLLRISPAAVMALILLMLVAGQVLAVNSLHVHLFSDCESQGEVHSDFADLGAHLDQIDINPDQSINGLTIALDLPVALLLTLFLGWPKRVRNQTPSPYGNAPPARRPHALLPPSRAPPIFE